MPYIRQYDRPEARTNPLTPGDLNYAITCLIVQYVGSYKLNYTFINDVLGALEGAKLEFYRRVVVPYENAKLAENGDVYALGPVPGSTDVVR